MKENNFVFADLSSFDIKVAQDFYTKVFQWEYHSSDSDYHLASYNNKEISGLYKTPQKFQDIGMPSFWMSYIQVEDLEATLSKAKNLGGIIELVDSKNVIGKIALIRDPLGAGFTIYEGNKLNSKFKNRKHALVWNALFVSQASKVIPFYEGVFNWKIEKVSNHKHNILLNSEVISEIQEVGNSIKGKFEYWGVFFAVESLAKTQKDIKASGGKVVYEDGKFTLCKDPFNAVFHIVQLKNVEDNANPNPLKWKAIFGLILISLSFLTNWHWIWILFFAVWIISDIKSGQTHMLEPVLKVETPILYWIVILVWTLIGIYSISYYLKPEWF